MHASTEKAMSLSEANQMETSEFSISKLELILWLAIWTNAKYVHKTDDSHLISAQLLKVDSIFISSFSFPFPIYAYWLAFRGHIFDLNVQRK